MELRDVECVLAVADELHFGRAAQRLHLGQPAVSAAVRRLEAELGGELFERTSRRVRLSSLGERFITAARPAYDALLEARELARNLARGVDLELRISYLGGGLYDLAPAGLSAFGQRFPRTEVTLVEIDCADHLSGLRERTLDGGFLRLPVHEPDLYVGKPFLTESRMLAVPVGHRLAEREIVDAEELADETFVEIPHSAPRYWVDFHLPPTTPAGRPIARGPTARTVQDALGAVALGRAVHLIGDLGARYYGRPDVRFVPIDLPSVQTAFIRRATDDRAVLRALEQCALQAGNASERPSNQKITRGATS